MDKRERSAGDYAESELKKSEIDYTQGAGNWQSYRDGARAVAISCTWSTFSLMQSKQINPQAIVALQDTLTAIYWYKNDLKIFLISVLGDSPLLVGIDWEGYKRNIVQQLLGRMTRNQERYRQELINLMVAAASINDFAHLERLEDGKQKALEARRAVRVLKNCTAGHEFIVTEQKLAEERRLAHAQRMQQITAVQAKLGELNAQYRQLIISSDRQARGYQLEKLLNELFKLFDLDPKASFRIEGEQIDGAFVFENTDFLFEAKWHDELVSTDALDSFAMKVERKFDAKGLFLSVNGFSPEAVPAHSSGKKVLLLMDGSDLAAIFEGRIDLKELLARKRRHAAHTGNIYITYREMAS